MTYRALIVDDEPLARLALAELLDERDEIVVVGEANSVRTAVHQINTLTPDLVFLDVRMRDGTGFDVLDRTPDHGHVVCVTAYGEHAVRAFEIDALDYLVKPVQRDQLDRALGRLVDRARPVAADAPPALFPRRHATASSSRPLKPADRVCLQRGRDIVFARLHDIVFLRAARDYTEIRLASGRMQVIKESLQAWEACLPHPPFVRIHRSAVVNLQYADALTRRDGGWQLSLRDVEPGLPVSRRLVARLKLWIRDDPA